MNCASSADYFDIYFVEIGPWEVVHVLIKCKYLLPACIWCRQVDIDDEDDDDDKYNDDNND